jgi:hypothetical protein
MSWSMVYTLYRDTNQTKDVKPLWRNPKIGGREAWSLVVINITVVSCRCLKNFKIQWFPGPEPQHSDRNDEVQIWTLSNPHPDPRQLLEPSASGASGTTAQHRPN